VSGDVNLSGNKLKSYQKRIIDVCTYIYENLDKDLSLDRLAQIASFSRYHFHRQFTTFTGVTVSKYIKLMRLKRASYQLVFKSDMRVIDVALEAGYENPESFSRAFKNIFSQSPSEFKRTPHWKPWIDKYQFSFIEQETIMNIEIVDFLETKIAVLEHREDSDLLNYSVSRFIEWRIQSKRSPVTSSNTYGIAYDDPETTDPEHFRFDICGSVNSTVPQNSQGVINKVIPAGRCALARHIGPHEHIGTKVRFLYREWLPGSGEDLRDFPSFFHYINLFPEVEEHELITDIYLPLV